MKVSITKKRLKEIIQEELKKRLEEEEKYNPEFAKYIYESLTKNIKKGESND